MVYAMASDPSMGIRAVNYSRRMKSSAEKRRLQIHKSWADEVMEARSIVAPGPLDLKRVVYFYLVIGAVRFSVPNGVI